MTSRVQAYLDRVRTAVQDLSPADRAKAIEAATETWEERYRRWVLDPKGDATAFDFAETIAGLGAMKTA